MGACLEVGIGRNGERLLNGQCALELDRGGDRTVL